jgi:hypothetical protein
VCETIIVVILYSERKEKLLKIEKNPFARVQGKGTSAFREAKKLLAAVEKENT